MAYMLRGKLNMLLYVVVCMFAGTLVGDEGRHGKRFATLLANVANVGSVYYARQRNVLACTVDPRKLHAADSKKLMQALKREYGVGVRQVMGITMQEARRGPNLLMEILCWAVHRGPHGR